MTSIANIMAGGRIIAEGVRGVAPLSVVKGSDEGVTGGVGTPQNDDSLLIPLTADTRYFFTLFFGYKGGTQGSSDIQFGFAVPSGTTMRWTRFGQTTGGAAALQGWNTESQTATLGTNGAGNSLAGLIIGSITTGGTAGNLQFQWAQNSGSAVTTSVLTGSVLAAWSA